MDENTFWIKAWGIISFTLFFVGMMFLTSDLYEAKKVSEMVKSGVPPEAVACVLTSTELHKTACTIYLSRLQTRKE